MKVSAAAQAMAKRSWYRIPYFVLTHMGESVGAVPNLDACKAVCSASE